MNVEQCVGRMKAHIKTSVESRWAEIVGRGNGFFELGMERAEVILFYVSVNWRRVYVTGHLR